MKLLGYLCLFVWLTAKPTFSQEIRMVKWKTHFASHPVKLKEDQQALLPLVRLSIQSMPESQLTQFGGVAAQQFGVASKNATDLQERLGKYYQKIDTDPLFKNLPTLLGYSYSATRPNYGLATVYQPKKVDNQTQTIVFLHGWGGSFHWYLHFMISCFPRDIIICPAYGISPSHIPTQYLKEALRESYRAIEIQPRKLPILIGLSAGGFGGFRAISQQPNDFQTLIALGAFPTNDVKPITRPPVKVLVGAEEGFVKNGTLNRSLVKLPRSKTEVHLLPGADHFFMLNRQDETRRILKSWVDQF